MDSPLTFQQIWDVLSFNPQFNGTFGPKGEPPLTNEENRKICALVTKKLSDSLSRNGQEFFSELWPHIKRQLACMNFFARKQNGELLGFYVLWNVTYRKTSLMVQKRIECKAKPIQTVVEQVAGEILRQREIA
ncbi:MAG: hypothetical protein KGL39_31970 [Patescibacteria group bacterium]|nr:hypothetical protein [Patescibacteria group bacterium]